MGGSESVDSPAQGAGTGDAGPTVSVLLPTRNGAKRVTAAIESVLGQSYRDLEVVVVNDGSTDGTSALLDKLANVEPRVAVVNLASSVGLQKALNTALSKARGDFVARIDDDDLWIDMEKLALQVAVMEKDETVQLVGTGCEIVDVSTGTKFVRVQPTSDREIRRTLLSWNPFVHSSVLFRRDAAISCGGYDESMRHGEDYDLWLRLGLRGLLLNLPEVCVRYCISNSVSSWSRRRRAWWEQLLLIRRYRDFYPGVGRALAGSVGRLALHVLPVGQSGRTLLRRARRR